MRKKYLTIKQLTEVTQNRYHVLSLKDNLSIVELRDKKLLIHRVGICDYKKCKAACCKFATVHSGKYWSQFGPLTNDRKSVIILRSCKQLRRDDTCKRWKAAHFPEECRQFPHPLDGTYKEIASKCSFKFEILGELK